jgi:hypothetical protein
VQITNNADISLALAVWLLHDDYDYNSDPDYISVTRLMRPIRHIVLPSRIPPQERVIDLSDLIARALGNSLHASIEKAWENNPQTKLRALGYPQHIVDRIRVNPSDEELAANPEIIPVFLEQRLVREFRGRKIGGKFDMVTEGIVNDTKSTSAYSWVYGTRDDENILQGSLYRWIDAAQPKPKITEDFMRINYIFTDWQKAQARQNPKYPQKRLEQKTLKLLSLDETEMYIQGKLDLIERFKNTPEPQLPHCTDEELWRSDPKFKYYSDPMKAKDPTARSTKNFETLSEANQHLATQGKGIVVTVPGEVKRCGYCDAFDACTQKDAFQL